MDAKVTLTVDSMISMMNIADHLTNAQCSKIAQQVLDGYNADVNSRKEWEEANANALKLALQVVEKKSEPWPGCSNVKFPLVTVAALHYQARAYPGLINDNDLVKAKPFGPDPTGEKAAQCDRISAHMTWQCMEQMPEWEENMDRGLLIQPILGWFAKKLYFDPVNLRNKSEVVSPKDLVVNYWVKGDINEAQRATHVIKFKHNDIYERVARGVWCNYGEVEKETAEEDRNESGEEKWADTAVAKAGGEPLRNAFTAEEEKANSMTRPPVDETTPVDVLEQICWLDLDDDGYNEPYFVVVERETGRLRRIVARWSSDGVYRRKGADKIERIVKIVPDAVYVKYGFIPNPDGSFYDLGFGRLLGPINDAVDTSLNMMIDAGNMATAGGGFVGRGARMKSGAYFFKPHEWKQVETIGGSLRDNLVPLPVREPSTVLFQLLGFLVSYAERIASANDLQVGENIGQNTPAATAQTMDQNGQRVYAGIFKRAWRAARDEFRILHQLNRLFIEQDPLYEDLVAAGGMLKPGDYDSKMTSICPAADPTVVSDLQKQQQAEMVMGLAFKVPGFNRYKSVRRVLESRRVPAIDEVFPPPPPNQDGTPGDLPSPPDPKMLEIQVKQGQLKLDQIEFQASSKLELMELQGKLQEMAAHTQELQAQAIKFLADAKSAGEGQEIALLNTAIGAYKHRMDSILGWVDHLLTAHKQTTEASSATPSGSTDNASGEGAMGGVPGNAGLFAGLAGGSGEDQGSSGNGGF